MLIIVSPAKKLDMTSVDGVSATTPDFEEQAAQLANVARGLTAADLKKLMGISDNLAKLNADRFRDFGTMERKPAAFAFAGDTYQGLEVQSLDADEMSWAQEHLRILSGLYGLLRPLDAIQPYRLEMGSRLANSRGKNLYNFWGDRIACAINAQARKNGTKILVNCASQEYFSAVDLTALEPRIVTPVFLEEKPGGPQIVSFFAKQARGAMARYIIQHRLTDPQALKDFDTGGYKFNDDLSDVCKPVFIRPQADG